MHAIGIHDDNQATADQSIHLLMYLCAKTADAIAPDKLVLHIASLISE